MFKKNLSLIQSSFLTSITPQIRRSGGHVGEILSGEITLDIVFSIQANLLKYIPRFVSKKKLLLMQQSFESALGHVGKKSSGALHIVNGSSILNNIFSTISAGSLTLYGNSVHSLVNSLSSVGTRHARANSALNNIYSISSDSSRYLGGNSAQSAIFSLSPLGNSTLVGNSALNNIYTLSPLGSIVLHGNMAGTIIHSLSSAGTRFAQGNSALTHIYTLSPAGNIIRGGSSAQSIIFLLSSTPSSTVSANSALSLINSLSALGSRYLYGYSTFSIGEFPDSIIFTLSGAGVKEKPGFAVLNNVFTMSPHLSGTLRGQYAGNMVFTLNGDLITATASLEDVLFNLYLVQSKQFNLYLVENKTFNLRV